MTHDLDDILLTLSMERRRRVLDAVYDEGIESQTELAAQIGEGKQEQNLELLHSSLPVLAQNGYIEWDRETGEIGPGPRADEIRAVINLFKEHTHRIPFNWP